MMLQLKRNSEVVLTELFKNVHFPQRQSRQSILLRSSRTEHDAPSTLNTLISGLEYLRTTDLRSKTPTLNLPVLLLHGAEDRIIPAAASEWLHERLPDSQLRIFKNDGHALPAHHFGEVMDEILRFL